MKKDNAMNKVNNAQDHRIRWSCVGDEIRFPNGETEKVIFKSTDRVNNYFLTQIQTINLKKNGSAGKIKSWYKIKHYGL